MERTEQVKKFLDKEKNKMIHPKTDPLSPEVISASSDGFFELSQSQCWTPNVSTDV